LTKQQVNDKGRAMLLMFLKTYSQNRNISYVLFLFAISVERGVLHTYFIPAKIPLAFFKESVFMEVR